MNKKAIILGLSFVFTLVVLMSLQSASAYSYGYGYGNYDSYYEKHSPHSSYVKTVSKGPYHYESTVRRTNNYNYGYGHYPRYSSYGHGYGYPSYRASYGHGTYGYSPSASKVLGYWNHGYYPPQTIYKRTSYHY